MARKRTRGEFTKPQLRAMLDYVGVPFAQQPKNVGEMQFVLDKYKQIEPERYDEAYAVIIEHRIPSAEAASEAGVPAEVFKDFSKFLDEMRQEFNEKTALQMATTASEKLLMIDQAITRMEEKSLAMAKAAIDEAAKQFRTVRVSRGKVNGKPVKGPIPKVFDRIVQLANQRKNILMVGPTGCGKTHLAGIVAEALELDYASQSCSEGMNESALTGWLLPLEKNGQFVYVSSEFVRIYENGGVFLFDEIDASDPNVLVFMNQAIAQDHFFLPQRHTQPRVQKHKDFVAIAAGNTFGAGADAMFVGRNQLDEATLNRFKIGTVYMDYDENVERTLIAARNEKVYDWCLAIRKAIDSHRLRRSMSTRNMIDAVDMIEGEGWKLQEVAEGYFADWSREELQVIRSELMEANNKAAETVTVGGMQ